MNKKTCIIILGPTAVGKTSLSLELAKQFGTSVISADSRQCFIEMNIGVAKPSPEQLAEVKHFFINSHHLDEEVNAAVFERSAIEWCNQIFKQNNVAIMVGGTGLYVKAFTEGLDEVPPSTIELRNQIRADYSQHGLEWLQQQVKKSDPFFFETGEMQNPQRLMRALEVIQISGRSILSFQLNKKKKRQFNILKIGLELPRAVLYDRINNRVDEMIQSGLVEEARSLFPYRHLNSLQTVGYKELFEHFDGKISMQEAIAFIKQNTRHYAKRQLTWFKKDDSIQWFDAIKTAACYAFVEDWLTKTIDPDQGMPGE